jgi:GNAT superfamily N-acetyltransferase
MSDLVLRPIEASDEPAVLQLLETALGGGPTGERSTEFFHWKHRANAFGPSFGLVAEDAGRVIAVRLFMRWQLRVGTETVHAVRAVDTATHPDYRGRGLFRTLTLQALDTWRHEIDVVFNTPNDKSGPGYLSMGWRTVGVLPVAIRVVKPFRFAMNVASAAAARRGKQAFPPSLATACPLPPAAEAFDDEAALAELLGEAQTRVALHTTVTPEYLRWRYGPESRLDYRCIRVERHGRLVGLAFARPRVRGRLSELMLSQLVVRPGDTAAARAVLRSARLGGTDHVVAHLGQGLPGRSAGYLTVPRWGIRLVANPRRPLPVDPLQLASWDLSLGDLEVF